MVVAPVFRPVIEGINQTVVCGTEGNNSSKINITTIDRVQPCIIEPVSNFGLFTKAVATDTTDQVATPQKTRARLKP